MTRSRAFVLYEHLDANAHVTFPGMKKQLQGRMHAHTVEAHANRLIELGILIPDGKEAIRGRRGPRPTRYRVEHRRLHEHWWTEFLGSTAVRQEFRRTIRWRMSYLRHLAPGGLDAPVAWLFDRSGRLAGARGPLDLATLEPRVRRAILIISRWLYREEFLDAALVFYPLLSYARGWPTPEPQRATKEILRFTPRNWASSPSRWARASVGNAGNWTR